MNKIDKETLLDIHTSMMDLIKEVRSILQLEAPTLIYDRAKVAWLDHLEAAMGHGKYEDAYNGTFWITLEELGILNMDGTVAELQDDPDAEPYEMDSKPSINDTLTTITPLKKEDDDNEGEDFVEAIYAMDANQTGLDRTESSTLGVVGESVRELMEEAPTKKPHIPFRLYEACSYHQYYHWDCPECNPNLSKSKKFWEGQPIQEPGATELPVVDFAMMGDWYGQE